MPSLPYFSSAVGLMIALYPPCVSNRRNAEKGWSILRTNVIGSGVEIEARCCQTYPLLPADLTSYILNFLSHMRRMLNSAAAASIGVPSWNLTPGRIFEASGFASGAIVPHSG